MAKVNAEIYRSKRGYVGPCKRDAIRKRSDYHREDGWRIYDKKRD